MTRPLPHSVRARAIAMELRISTGLLRELETPTPPTYSRGRSRPARINGRIVNWFGLMESDRVQPDRSGLVLRLGPGGSYERVFYGGGQC